jgi:hypothetical protein
VKRTKAVLYTLADVAKFLGLMVLMVAGAMVVFGLIIGITLGVAWLLRQLLGDHGVHAVGIATGVIFAAALFGAVCWPLFTDIRDSIRNSYRRNLKRAEKK